jgi:hypothetical protein
MEKKNAKIVKQQKCSTYLDEKKIKITSYEDRPEKLFTYTFLE